MNALLTDFCAESVNYVSFSKALRYPHATWKQELVDFAKEFEFSNIPAFNALQEFLKTTQDFSLEQLQETYTRAFDVAPQSIPYLSVYLFGEESHKRSELMTGLLEAYEAAGYTYENELPDHLSVILGYAAHCADSEWTELAHWVIPGPLVEMLRSLERTKNPYEHVLRALTQVFKANFPQEFCHV